jgi:hypothetical protein
VVYDIACQWYINFRRRVNTLSLPEDLKIIPAVGKFHLSAHKPECLPRFSLMFVQGAGHIDGDILEILWAPFNKISPLAWSMTLARHQELCDDHIRDSNWKKLIGLGEILLKGYAFNGLPVQQSKPCARNTRLPVMA